jgi:hypothetical protein
MRAILWKNALSLAKSNDQNRAHLLQKSWDRNVLEFVNYPCELLRVPRQFAAPKPHNYKFHNFVLHCAMAVDGKPNPQSAAVRHNNEK